MTYSEQCLTKGENVIRRAAISKVTLIPTLIIGAIIAVLGIIVGSLTNGIVIVVGILVAAIYIAINILVLKNIELTVTDKKLIGKTGVIVKRALCAPLNKVDSIYFNQGFLAKIFGYGTLVVHTTHSRFAFNYIVDAVNFQNLIMECVDLYYNKKEIKVPAAIQSTASNTVASTSVKAGWTCSSCGTQNGADYRFCSKCGSPKAQ